MILGDWRFTFLKWKPLFWNEFSLSWDELYKLHSFESQLKFSLSYIQRVMLQEYEQVIKLGLCFISTNSHYFSTWIPSPPPIKKSKLPISVLKSLYSFWGTHFNTRGRQRQIWGVPQHASFLIFAETGHVHLFLQRQGRVSIFLQRRHSFWRVWGTKVKLPLFFLNFLLKMCLWPQVKIPGSATERLLYAKECFEMRGTEAKSKE